MDIVGMAKDNDKYRAVVSTTKDVQVVIMSLLPHENIPEEIHQGAQTIFVVEGIAYVALNNETITILGPGNMIIIPADTSHYVSNNGRFPLKLISHYSPPEHEYDAYVNRQPTRT